MIAAEGHGWGLAAFPLGAAAIAAVFAAVLIRRSADRWRWHEAVWALALLMYAVASFAMFLGVAAGWSAVDYRLYWLLGAVLNVPFLAAGEVYLLTGASRRTAAHGVLMLLIVAGIFAAVAVWTAPLEAVALADRLPLGKDTFVRTTPYRLAQVYAFPAYFFLLGGLVWAAAQMKGKPELRDRTIGTLGIAVGATIVAIGSGIGAGSHLVPLFSASLALGIAVMFWGFLRASGTRLGRRDQTRAGAT